MKSLISVMYLVFVCVISTLFCVPRLFYDFLFRFCFWCYCYCFWNCSLAAIVSFYLKILVFFPNFFFCSYLCFIPQKIFCSLARWECTHFFKWIFDAISLNRFFRDFSFSVIFLFIFLWKRKNSSMFLMWMNERKQGMLAADELFIYSCYISIKYDESIEKWQQQANPEANKLCRNMWKSTTFKSRTK